MLMGIYDDNVQNTYKDLYQGYLNKVFNFEKSTAEEFRTQHQIEMDVHRTFSTSNI